MHRREDQPIVAPETFSAADWLHEKHGQEKTLGKRAAAGTEAGFAAAIAATVRFEREPVGGAAHIAPRNGKYEEARNLKGQ